MNLNIYFRKNSLSLKSHTLSDDKKQTEFNWELSYGVKPNTVIHHAYKDIEVLKNCLGNNFRRFNKSIWNHLELNLQVILVSLLNFSYF